MEFEEMKKVWNTQKQEHVFTLDQSALHQRVLTKQTQGLHITNVSEMLLMLVNVVAPIAILLMTLSKGTINISMIILSCWMLFTSVYVAYQRGRRIKENNRFERSLSGDLQFALNVARYQVRLSALGRWNILPIGILSLAGLLEAHKPFWLATVFVLFLAIINYAAGMESNFYKRRLNELDGLKKKLEEPG